MRHSTLTRVQVGQVPGRKLRVRRADGRTDVFRLYLMERWLYSVGVIADGKVEQPAERQPFLTSLRLFP